MSGVLRLFKWIYYEFGIVSIHATGRNAYLIILARSCRMFAHSTNSLILAIFFSALGFSDHQIGAFMTLTLLGDVLLGTFLTLIADRVGRRNILMGGSLLMITSGTTFALFENFWILLLAAVLGVISVTGGDFGPFRSIEESILSEVTTSATRSDVLAWYVTTAALGSSIGSEASGRIIHFLQGRDGWTPVDAYHTLFWLYTVMGVVNSVLVLALTNACELQGTKENYAKLSQSENENLENGSQQQAPDVEAGAQKTRIWDKATKSWLFHQFARISAPTRSVMYKLWFLLAVDALADGMVPYSLTNYYIDTKFQPAKSTLGDVTSASYFLAAIGASFAGPLAHRIGLINTMVFTHVPSSAAVLFFPFAPVFWMTAGLLLVRAGLNNMDQAPRSAFIAAVVKSDERTAVLGITSMVRTLAAMAGPTITGLLAASKRFWVAFVVAGACRLAYDFGLYALFVNFHNVDRSEDELDEHEGRSSLDEEMLELQSLVDSETSDEADDGKKVGSKHSLNGSSLQLQPPIEKVRNRSPHRSTSIDGIL